MEVVGEAMAAGGQGLKAASQRIEAAAEGGGQEQGGQEQGGQEQGEAGKREGPAAGAEGGKEGGQGGGKEQGCAEGGQRQGTAPPPESVGGSGSGAPRSKL